MFGSVGMRVSVDEIVLAMLRARLRKLNRWHPHNPFLVVRIAGTQPPCVNLPGNAAVRTIPFELILFLRIPYRVDLLVAVVDESRDIYRAIGKPVPG